jgi:hypothetical protein
MGVRSAAGGRRPGGVAVAGFGWMGRAEQAAAQFGFATATRQAGVQGTVEVAAP